VNRIAYSACIALALYGTTVQAQQRSPKTTRAAKKSVPAAAWKTAYSDNIVTVAVDTKHTAKQADGTYSAHLKWTYAGDQAIGRGETYRSMVETRLINCDSMRTKSIRGTTYTAVGKQVSSYDTKPSDVQYLAWSTRKPGSSGQNAIEGVCKTIAKP
jgi:hypothetical protein